MVPTCTSQRHEGDPWQRSHRPRRHLRRRPGEEGRSREEGAGQEDRASEEGRSAKKAPAKKAAPRRRRRPRRPRQRRRRRRRRRRPRRQHPPRRRPRRRHLPRRLLPPPTATAPEPAALVERRGHLLIVTLNRPERKNAINGEMLVRMLDAFVEADTNPDIRAIVLTGSRRRLLLRRRSQGDGRRLRGHTAARSDRRAGPHGRRPRAALEGAPALVAAERADHPGRRGHRDRWWHRAARRDRDPRRPDARPSSASPR